MGVENGGALMAVTKIQVSKITMDPETQPRVELNSELLAEYGQELKAGTAMPPVVIFADGGVLWLADGWHRVLGAKQAGIKEISADIRTGTKRDAILYSVAANATHGSRRTNADKRRAVLALLKDSEWKKWSDREIARRCKVTQPFVSETRKSLITDISDSKTLNPPEYQKQTTCEFHAEDQERKERIYTDRYGNESTMDVSNIGKKQGPNKPTFNRTNENIGWAGWSWNPVTGCKQGCPYCYARDIAMRFTGHFNPEFHKDRLDAPKNTNPLTDVKGGNRVFVCSMADLFGPWIPEHWKAEVFERVIDNPQWTFLFLTKHPEKYPKMEFPENAWIGVTVDRQAAVKNAEKYMEPLKAKFKFVSCEPLQEKIVFTKPEIFNAFIIGARSASTGAPALQPEWPWVLSILNQAATAKKLVWWKDNLNRPQQL